MNDCSNAEIRDQLPDLLHERLDAPVRAVVLAHVSGCIDCRDELELLRSVHKTLIAQTPRVDIAYVIGALPKAPAARPRIQPVARRRWADWRIAAAVTVLVAGGSSLAVLRRAPAVVNAPVQIADSTPTRPVSPIASETAGSAPSRPSPTNANRIETIATADEAEDGVDGRFGGLSDEQMQALLGEIEKLQAVPVSEPEPVTIRVDINPNGAEEIR